jgi:hypothetical protein
VKLAEFRKHPGKQEGKHRDIFAAIGLPQGKSRKVETGFPSGWRRANPAATGGEPAVFVPKPID